MWPRLTLPVGGLVGEPKMENPSPRLTLWKPEWMDIYASARVVPYFLHWENFVPPPSTRRTYFWLGVVTALSGIGRGRFKLNSQGGNSLSPSEPVRYVHATAGKMCHHVLLLLGVSGLWRKPGCGRRRESIHPRTAVIWGQ